MALRLVTDVTAEPVSVIEQKEHLRIDDDYEDAYIAAAITAARTWVEGQTKRAIMDQTWAHDIDYDWPMKAGQQRIDLPLNPVPVQTSPSTVVITYTDADNAAQTLAQTQYIVVGRTHGSYIVPEYDVEWPTVRRIPNAITVQFQAGDSDNIPGDLKHAIMLLAGHYYENREAVIKGGYNFVVMPAPFSVESLVSPYRRATF